MMDKLRKHDEDVVCIHPAPDLITGWLAIRESWVTIFSNTEMIRFILTNTKVESLVMIKNSSSCMARNYRNFI